MLLSGRSKENFAGNQFVCGYIGKMLREWLSFMSRVSNMLLQECTNFRLKLFYPSSDQYGFGFILKIVKSDGSQLNNMN